MMVSGQDTPRNPAPTEISETISTDASAATCTRMPKKVKRGKPSAAVVRQRGTMFSLTSPLFQNRVALRSRATETSLLP